MLVVAAIVTSVAASTPAVRVRAQDGDRWLPNQPIAEGQRVFRDKHCVDCHGIPGDAKAQRIAPDLLLQPWHDVMQLAGAFWNHAPTMIDRMRERGIDRPTLSPEETGKLAAYLFYLRFLNEPGDARRGSELFQQRACERCHQLGGRGGTVGPRLDELKPYATSLFLAQALWNHGSAMAAKMAELRIDRPRLEPGDVADIVAFIRGDATPLGSVEAGNPRIGKVLFAQKACIQCHAISGSGGTVGPDLGKSPAVRNVSQLAGALWNHGPTMWAKMKEMGIPALTLSDRDLADLFAYVCFVQYTDTRGDAEKGGRIFDAKSCGQCHAVGGHTPKAGPDLAGSTALRSPLDWASAVWNHAPAVDTAMRDTHTPWPRFEDDEMRDLVEFLRVRDRGN